MLVAKYVTALTESAKRQQVRVVIYRSDTELTSQHEEKTA